jgi:hypothetical protein
MVDKAGRPEGLGDREALVVLVACAKCLPFSLQTDSFIDRTCNPISR